MRDVAIAQDDLTVNFSADLLAKCDLAANAYASAARAGNNPGEILVIAPRSISTSDLALITWAAHLGYREGLELRAPAGPPVAHPKDSAGDLFERGRKIVEGRQ